jgi:hypothetical protein
MVFAFDRHDADALRAWREQLEAHVEAERERPDFEQVVARCVRRVRAGGFVTIEYGLILAVIGLLFFLALLPGGALVLAILAVPLLAALVPQRASGRAELPLGAKEGGGDRVGLAIVFRHHGGPLVAVFDLEALLVPLRQIPVSRELIAGKVEEGLGEEVEGRVGWQGTEVAEHADGRETVLGRQHGVEVRQAATSRRCR